MGKFEIAGIQQNSGKSVLVILDADDQPAAMASAAAMGIAVHRISPIGDAAPPPIADPAPVSTTRAVPPLPRPAAPPIYGDPFAAPQPAGTLSYARPEAEPFGTSRRMKYFGWLFGIEAVLIVGITLLYCISDGNGFAESMSIAFTSSVGLAVVQFLFLLPIARPTVKQGRGTAFPLWLGGAVAGLFVAAIVCSAVMLLGEAFWAAKLEDTSHDDFISVMQIIAIVTMLVSWGAGTPLLVGFMRKRARESVLGRLSAMLLLGSVVEVIAAIPISSLVEKRKSCFSETFTALSMFISMAVFGILFGPACLLAIFLRRSRAASRGRCAACGHDLRGLPTRDRCPACGAGWKVTN
jgi:hypothetical protein